MSWANQVSTFVNKINQDGIDNLFVWKFAIDK